MVVLENSDIMTSPSGHQYLQPDYLSPLPTTLDAKKSPLALLAQTCSQIGADSPTTKPLLATLDKPKKPSSNSIADRASVTPPKPSDLSVGSKNGLAFKPYEANVLTKKSDSTTPTSRPASKPSSIEQHLQAHNHQSHHHAQHSSSASSSSTTTTTTSSVATQQGSSPGLTEEKRRTPSRKSVSPKDEHKSPAPEKSADKSSDSGASPIIRSGIEVLQGTTHKDGLGFKTPLGPLGLPPGCCPPGLEANPAFRPPLGGHMMYPGPYVSYARVKTPGGGEALVPVCKDPYCGGCQVGVQHALMGGACPSGCTQCEHQKYLASLMPPHPLSYVGRPYVCNWIAGESYCGKRFTTSDELLTHLRSHTADTSLLNPLRYPNPPLSPLSAARYHPYGKPGALPPALQSPFSAFNPTLAPYYSPYLYGQRIGAAVHP